MIGALRTPEQQTVTVFGGSGFLGRYVVERSRPARLPDPGADPAAEPLELPAPRQGGADHADPCQSAQRGFDRPCGGPGGSRGQSGGHPAGDRPPALRRPPGAGSGHDRAACQEGRVLHPCLGHGRRCGLRIGLCPLQGRGRGRPAPGAARCGDSAPVADVRAGRQLLQPLRGARPHAPGRAAARRRDPVPADLCRRRGRGDRRGRWTALFRAAGSTNSAGPRSAPCAR